jgi:hypothetical protein
VGYCWLDRNATRQNVLPILPFASSYERWQAYRFSNTETLFTKDGARALTADEAANRFALPEDTWAQTQMFPLSTLPVFYESILSLEPWTVSIFVSTGKSRNHQINVDMRAEEVNAAETERSAITTVVCIGSGTKHGEMGLNQINDLQS